MSLQRIFLTILFCTCFSMVSGFSQAKHFDNENDKWYVGTAETFDGRKIKAELNYNFVNDRLSVRKGEYRRTFGSHQIRAFQFKDSIKLTQFVSLDYSNPKTGAKGQYFYKLVSFNKEYMILSRLRLQFKGRNHDRSYDSEVPTKGLIFTNQHVWKNENSNYSLNIESVTMTIYVKNKLSPITPIMQKEISRATGYSQNTLNTILNDGMDWIDANYFQNYGPNKVNNKKLESVDLNKKFKLINAKVYQDYFGEVKYEAFKAFAKKHQFNIKTPEGLIHALNFNL